jgi:glucose/mannose-6-phosphate isomerase
METGYQEMRSFVLAFPDMWESMWAACEGFRPDLGEEPTAMFMSGMGGSAIGSSLLESLAGPEARIPFVVNRSYEVSSWVGPETISVFTSYSGNTEETLSAFRKAGLQRSRRVAITTGGELGRLCDEEGVPVKRITPGLPPRAALPFTLVPQLHLARYLELVDIPEEHIAETSMLLEDLSRAEAGGGGLADDIARRLVDRIPVVLSGSGLMPAVNLRWRGQIQENSKSLAFGNLYPELNHNEIVGWQASPSITSEIVVIELADKDDALPIRKRMDLTRELLEVKAADWIRVETQGRSRMARMMWAVLLGDWVSLHLARLKGVDPMPVELIDALKSGLAGSS